MLDPKLLRNDLDNTAKKLQRRGFVVDTSAIAALEEKRKQVQVRAQELQAERNAKSKAIGMAKAKGEDTSAIMQEVASIGTALKQAEDDLEHVQDELNDIVSGEARGGVLIEPDTGRHLQQVPERRTSVLGAGERRHVGGSEIVH